jgi:hypothetical protein
LPRKPHIDAIQWRWDRWLTNNASLSEPAASAAITV